MLNVIRCLFDHHYKYAGSGFDNSGKCYRCNAWLKMRRGRYRRAKSTDNIVYRS